MWMSYTHTHTELHLKVFLRLGPLPAQFLSHSQGHLTAVISFLYIFSHIQININTHAQTDTFFFFFPTKVAGSFYKRKNAGKKNTLLLTLLCKGVCSYFLPGEHWARPSSFVWTFFFFSFKAFIEFVTVLPLFYVLVFWWGDTRILAS